MKDQRFSLDDFLKPNDEWYPIYSWVWNAPVTKEETDRRLDEFVRLGIKAFYIIPEPKTFRPMSIPTMLEPDYLTEPYYEEYAYAIRSALARGIRAWIYDEGGWPSGGACGKVLMKHPELARRGLGQRRRSFKKGEIYSRPSDIASAFLPDGSMINDGYSFAEDTEVSEYYSERNFFRWQGIPDFPDLTLSESTDAFIEETFPGYESRLSELFGNGISAVFSDEPEAPRPVPFRQELEKEYERRWGESIRPHLDVLWKNIERLWKDYEDVSVPEKSAQAIIRWYDLCSETFCKSYLLREKKWCNDRGLSFIGHLNGDDLPMGSVRSASYHLMRALRSFDIPAVDVIWRQIFPGESKEVEDIVTAENRFFPRYASSAAAQIGGRLSATESFGVYGQGLTYSQMRFVIAFQAIRGINIFNFMLKNYGRTGLSLAGERPDFSEDTHIASDLKCFNEYTARLSYITALGERDVDTALYFPICDVWSGANTKTVCEGYEQAGYELERDGIYFDIIDDDVLCSCCDNALLSGRISMGNACYKTVVIPPTKYIPEASVKKLEEFISHGGRVLVAKSEITPKIQGAITVDNCVGKISSPVDIDFSSGELRTYSKLLENGRLDMIFNQSTLAQPVRLKIKEKPPILVDITAGKLRSLTVKNREAVFELESGECAALLYTDEEFELEPLASRTLPLDGKYLFKKQDRFVLGEMNAYREKFDEPYSEAHTGDMRELVGKSFSGSCVYATEFETPEDVGDFITVDLGRVEYSAEVFVNGTSVGVLVMPPYRFTFSSNILSEKNLLEVRVTNSASNEYKYTKIFDKWASWQLSPYHKKQMTFCNDNLSGGLFGPVKIMY